MESKTLAGDIEEREGGHDRETPFEHLAVRDVDSVHEDVDPRLSLSSRPSANELDESIPKHLTHALNPDHIHPHHHLDSQPEKGPSGNGSRDGDVDVDLEKKANGKPGERSQSPSAEGSEEIFYVGT